MLSSIRRLGQSAHAGAKRRVDERHAVLSAPRCADCTRSRDPHRHRMGADQRLAGPVLAQHVADQFGDSDVHGVLSVDISDWEAPGSDGRSAMQCSREEVTREVWTQLKRSINIEQELLRDEDLHSWFLDPDIRTDRDPSGLSDERRAAAGEPGRHLDAASRRGDRPFRICFWRPIMCARIPTSRRWKGPTRRRGGR